MSSERPPDSDVLAEKLEDAGFAAKEILFAELSSVFSSADPGHPVVDEPEKYRWFLIEKFPTKNFGITLQWLMRESGSFASHQKFKVDRILALLKAGLPEWPAFVTAEGVVVDGYHRIAAHRVLGHKYMAVVVAVNSSGGTHWDEAWLQSALDD